MIDTVIGAAHGYSASQLRPFLASLKQTGFEGRVIMFATGGGAEECKRWGVDLRPCPIVKNLPHADRFFWIQEAVEKLDCAGLLLADTRDVIFQSNPGCLSGIGLHVFLEDASHSLSSCPYNSQWIRIGYGQKMLKEIGHFPISCVGTIHGGLQEIRGYLGALRMELERIQPLTRKPQDQAAHNYLIRKKLNSTIWPNEDADIYTVGYIPRGTVKIVGDKKNSFIINKAGKVPAVIHQWDRHMNLKKFVEEKYENVHK